MIESEQITLCNDVARVSERECLLDVMLDVDGLEITLTVRGKVDEDDRITWAPERVLGACWADGTVVVVDRAFCSADWEVRLRKHSAQIERWISEWSDCEREREYRHASLERRLAMVCRASW